VQRRQESAQRRKCGRKGEKRGKTRSEKIFVGSIKPGLYRGTKKQNIGAEWKKDRARNPRKFGLRNKQREKEQDKGE